MDSRIHHDNRGRVLHIHLVNTSTAVPVASGLEDVVAASTRLSDVDGEAGRLVIAGVPVEELAGHATFEDAVYLLWHGRRPSAEERASVRTRLGAARAAASFREVATTEPMDRLRARMAQLPSSED